MLGTRVKQDSNFCNTTQIAVTIIKLKEWTEVYCQLPYHLRVETGCLSSIFLPYHFLYLSLVREILLSWFEIIA